jgi:hypothetical protein
MAAEGTAEFSLQARSSALAGTIIEHGDVIPALGAVLVERNIEYYAR